MDRQNIIILIVLSFIGIKTFYLYFYSSQLPEKLFNMLENPKKKSPKPRPLSGDLHLHLHQHQIIRKPPEKIPKIVILSQARSGSTFLGALMSASFNAYYVFEPFQKVKLNNTPIDDLIEDHSSESAKTVQKIFDIFFQCKYTTYPPVVIFL